MILASLRLERDVALSWYESRQRERPVGAAPWIWEEFSAMFLDRFMLESVSNARAVEFEGLRQGRLSVSKCDIRFT